MCLDIGELILWLLIMSLTPFLLICLVVFLCNKYVENSESYQNKVNPLSESLAVDKI